MWDLPLCGWKRIILAYHFLNNFLQLQNLLSSDVINNFMVEHLIMVRNEIADVDNLVPFNFWIPQEKTLVSLLDFSH